MNIDKTKPVLVTGATGYVAGWLIKRLLEEGITVHAAVRNPEDKQKVEHLVEMALASKGKIHFFKSDLLTEGAYDQAMMGCELVYHTASPFIMKVKNAQRDLIDPALKGTRNVLEAANRIETVKRVVVTSSCAAIYGDAIDLNTTKNGVFTEEDWNTTSSATHQAYSYSKVLAEKEAWKIAEAQQRWDLVTVNPALIIGPGTNAKATSASFDIVKQMGNGMMKMGVPDLNIGAVDVRDVAEAHYKAGFTPGAKGRYINFAENTSLLKLAQHLYSDYGSKYPLPKKHLAKWLVWLVAPMSGMTRKEVTLSIGHPWNADNSKGIKELGMVYRPLDVAMKEMFQQLIDTKQI